MTRIQCKDCEYKPDQYDSLAGYCMTCAQGKIQECDQLQAELAKLTKQRDALLESCKSAIITMQKEPVQGTGEWESGLFCGLEDRSIHDRYEACRYGYDQALDKVQEWIIDELEETSPTDTPQAAQDSSERPKTGCPNCRAPIEKLMECHPFSSDAKAYYACDVCGARYEPDEYEELLELEVDSPGKDV